MIGEKAMKKKVWIFIFIFITTTFGFAKDITFHPYGERIVYVPKAQINDNIIVPLSFSLAEIQSYEFGFTQDESVSLRTQTTTISTLPLSRDEEREAEGNNSRVIASASFKIYWKIISGYGLKFYLAANGPFKSSENNLIDYSIYDIGDNIILGYKGNNSSNYTDNVEIGSFSPDYGNQDFSEAGSVSLEIVTTDDLSKAFDSSSSYSTILTISVKVTN